MVKTKRREINYLLLIAIFSLILNIGLAVHIGWHHQHPNTIVKTEVKFDTIINFEYKTDTVHVKETETKYKTIVVNDTVYIEDRGHNYHYGDDVYTLDINAVKLNWYNLNIHKKDTITFTKEIEVPIYVKQKKSHWYYGIGVGVGYGIFSKKPDVYVGLNAGFRF